MEKKEGVRRDCFINSHNVELDIDTASKTEPRDLHLTPHLSTHLYSPVNKII